MEQSKDINPQSFVSVTPSVSGKWTDQVIDLIETQGKASVYARFPPGSVRIQRDVLRAAVQDAGLSIGVHVHMGQVRAWKLDEGEEMPPAQLRQQKERAKHNYMQVKPWEPKQKTLIEVPERLLPLLDARRVALGLRSRNELIVGALEALINAEPLVEVEDLCAGCAHAGTHPDAIHCGLPRHEIGREPDKQWNANCPPGRERIVVRICVCAECAKDTASPPLQKS